MQGVGILMASGVTAIVTSIFIAAFPANAFPVYPPGCNSWNYVDKNATPKVTCPAANQTFYWNQIQGSTPIQADFVCK